MWYWLRQRKEWEKDEPKKPPPVTQPYTPPDSSRKRDVDGGV